MKRSFTTALAIAMAISAAAPLALAQPDRGPDRGSDRGGPPQQSDWRKGGRVAPGDWQRGQHVDYRSHHLRKPPRGYEWRQVDNRYVLAAAATGLIAGLVISGH
jgi:Ni/Co efflux regulator RcnB